MKIVLPLLSYLRIVLETYAIRHIGSFYNPQWRNRKTNAFIYELLFFWEPMRILAQLSIVRLHKLSPITLPVLTSVNKCLLEMDEQLDSYTHHYT